MIYFIRSPDGPIKIGTSIRLSERLKGLVFEYGEGLEVLAVVEGDRAVERKLHRRFAHLRKVGEWFEPGDDLIGFIVSDGKPWDGSDEAPPMHVVKLDRTLADKAKLVASRKGLTLAEYLTEMTRPTVERDFARVIKELGGQE